MLLNAKVKFYVSSTSIFLFLVNSDAAQSRVK